MSELTRIEQKIDKVMDNTTQLELHVREKLTEHGIKIAMHGKDINYIGKKVRGVKSLILAGFSVVVSVIVIIKFLGPS